MLESVLLVVSVMSMPFLHRPTGPGSVENNGVTLTVRRVLINGQECLEYQRTVRGKRLKHFHEEIGIKIGSIVIRKGKHLDVVYQTDRVVSWTRVFSDGSVKPMRSPWPSYAQIEAISSDSVMVACLFNHRNDAFYVYQPRSSTWRKFRTVSESEAMMPTNLKP